MRPDLKPIFKHMIQNENPTRCEIESLKSQRLYHIWHIRVIFDINPCFNLKEGFIYQEHGNFGQGLKRKILPGGVWHLWATYSWKYGQLKPKLFLFVKNWINRIWLRFGKSNLEKVQCDAVYELIWALWSTWNSTEVWITSKIQAAIETHSIFWKVEYLSQEYSFLKTWISFKRNSFPKSWMVEIMNTPNVWRGSKFS